MKLQEIAQKLSAEIICVGDERLMEYDYKYAFATDLMSDALAMIQTANESTVLLTGLVNMQSLRTAEMLDIRLVVYVRSKPITDDLIQLAKEMQIALLVSDYSMYEASGRLYIAGLQSFKQ